MASGGRPSLQYRVSASIRAEAARRGITQAALARDLGVNPRTFRRRMAGSGSPWTLDEVDEFADYFGVPPLALVASGVIQAGDVHVMADTVHVHDTRR